MNADQGWSALTRKSGTDNKPRGRQINLDRVIVEMLHFSFPTRFKLKLAAHRPTPSARRCPSPARRLTTPAHRHERCRPCARIAVRGSPATPPTARPASTSSPSVQCSPAALLRPPWPAQSSLARPAHMGPEPVPPVPRWTSVRPPSTASRPSVDKPPPSAPVHSIRTRAPSRSSLHPPPNLRPPFTCHGVPAPTRHPEHRRTRAWRCLGDAT